MVIVSFAIGVLNGEAGKAPQTLTAEKLYRSEVTQSQEVSSNMEGREELVWLTHSMKALKDFLILYDITHKPHPQPSQAPTDPQPLTNNW